MALQLPTSRSFSESASRRKPCTRYNYSPSSTLPVKLIKTTTKVLGNVIVSQWKAPEKVLTKSELLAEISADFDYGITTFDDVALLNKYFGHLLLFMMESSQPKKMRLLLADMLENLEKLQAALGQIEVTLCNQEDISAELELSFVKINQDYARIIQKAKTSSGFTLTTLAFDCGVTKSSDSLRVEPCKIVNSKKSSACVYATTIVSSGLTSWQVSITYSGDQGNIAMGVFASQASSSRLSDGKNDQLFYDINIPVVGYSVTSYLKGRSSTSTEAGRQNYYGRANPTRRTSSELITVTLDLQSSPNTFSLSSLEWEANAFCELPYSCAWRPVFLLDAEAEISL